MKGESAHGRSPKGTPGAAARKRAAAMARLFLLAVSGFLGTCVFYTLRYSAANDVSPLVMDVPDGQPTPVGVDEGESFRLSERQEIDPSTVPMEVNALLGLLRPPQERSKELSDEEIRAIYARALNEGSSDGGGGDSGGWAGGDTCRARRERRQYHKHSRPPSVHLRAALFQYSQFHAACMQLAEGRWGDTFAAAEPSPGAGRQCQFLLYEETKEGLGNKLVALVSAFLYALLTQRVLVLHRAAVPARLLCQLAGSRWLLGDDFPAASIRRPMGIRQYLKEADRNPNGPGSPAAAVHVQPGALFACERPQALLRKAPWLLLQAKVYFVPELFLVAAFRPLLERLFPDRSVLAPLSQHLLLPRDRLWAGITWLARASSLAPPGGAAAAANVGMHLRFMPYENKRRWDNHQDYVDFVSQRTLECSTTISHLLPEPGEGWEEEGEEEGNRRLMPAVAPPPRYINVFIASLFSLQHEAFLRRKYGGPTRTGDVVSLTHVTADERQRSDMAQHRSAFAEMWLLSFCDDLVLSANSTFSHVAQGLAGVAPWVLNFQSFNDTRACARHLSSEACHLSAPLRLDCGPYDRKLHGADPAAIVPYVQRCPERRNSLRLVPPGAEGGG